MKKTIILILALIFSNISFGQTENDFLNDYINTFYELHNTSIEFDKQLLYIQNIDSAKKTIDTYSLQIEKSIGVFTKYKNTKNSQISEVSTDLTKLLSDILRNNYQLLGKLIKDDYSKDNLKKDCLELVNKNQFASNFFKDISLGVCMVLAKEKPKEAKENQQFLKLTKKERNQINELLIEKFGKSIEKGKQIKSKTPFEYSCRLIYEFINMKWEFENED